MKLKTLKDFEGYGWELTDDGINKLIPRGKDLPLVLRAELKQGVIKWIKEIQKQVDGEGHWVNILLTREQAAGAGCTLKHFFNITEEDLKEDKNGEG